MPIAAGRGRRRIPGRRRQTWKGAGMKEPNKQRPAGERADPKRTPDRQGRPAAGERRTEGADIPDDYGHETSHPDDLEPPDEHRRR